MREWDFVQRSEMPLGVLPFRKFVYDDVVNISLASTSKGNQDKYKSCDGLYYIKTRFLHQQRLWHDDFVEVIASQYTHQCNFSGDVPVVRQGLCRLGNEECSYSEAFDVDNWSFTSFSRYLDKEFDTLSRLSTRISDKYTWFCTLRDFYNSALEEDATEYLVAMMLLDLVVANEDRHLSNFGYLSCSETLQMVPCPLFDFGLGLFEHSTLYYEGTPLDRAVKKIRIKPWSMKVLQVLDLLNEHFSSDVSAMLPVSVDLSKYHFPSVLAKNYFQWINERLGVQIVGV